MTAIPTPWSHPLDFRSSEEGWGIFDTGGANGHPDFEIQKIDCPEDGEGWLDDDADAWRLVVGKAAGGSALHLRTLTFLALYSPEELFGIANFLLYGQHRTYLHVKRFVQCPRGPDTNNVHGCGLFFEADPDDEGLFDCPRCGLFFDPDDPHNAPQPARQ